MDTVTSRQEVWDEDKLGLKVITIGGTRTLEMEVMPTITEQRRNKCSVNFTRITTTC